MASTVQLQSQTPATKTQLEPYVTGTLFAGPYKSNFLNIHAHLKPLLGHLNCGFFSTRGQAPTLLELKQHAQALLIIIKHLTVATTSTPVDDPNSAIALAIHEARRIAEERNVDNQKSYEAALAQKKAADADPKAAPQREPEKPAIEIAAIRALAFDFLADLTVPYDNSDPVHQVALTGLLNSLEDRGALDRHGRDHCPLHLGPVLAEDNSHRKIQALPYAETWKLIKHADELLERLDHEFSAEGGVLGMLPIGTEGEDESTAVNLLGKRSVLGQWVAFTRALATRVHELEANLKEALHIVSGEAVVPKLMLAQTPVTARMANGLATTEDWIISVPHGAHKALREEFAKREEEVFDNKLHTVGSGTGTQDIITVDVLTRYSRLREGNTIFITPGKIEKEARLRPGVVQVVKGEWRSDRSSVFESKHRAELERLRHMERYTLPQLKSEAESRKEAVEVLMAERNAYLISGGDLNVSEEEKELLREELLGEEIRALKGELEREREQLGRERDELEVEKKRQREFAKRLDEWVVKEKERVAAYVNSGGADAPTWEEA